MSRFIKCLSNELIKIEEYKNPRVCFNSTEYDDIENYCVLRKTINPFDMLKENLQLKEELENASKNYTKYIQERDNVLDEIREYIDKEFYTIQGVIVVEPDDIKEILDKVKQ